MSAVATFISAVRTVIERLLSHVATRVIAAASVGWLVAVRSRLLPNKLLKVHFNVNLFLAMAGANVVILSARLLRPVLPKSFVDEWLSAWTTVCMRYHRYSCPHIQIQYAPGSLNWSDIPYRGSIVCVNHLSFFDVLLFMWVAPIWHMKHLKTFYKSDLAKIPLLGCILKDCGMLPVYFIKNASNEFSVDKDKQQKVVDRANAFVAEKKGNLSFYPEGGINRVNPRELATFRHGSFSLIQQNKCDTLYYVVTCGNEQVWPPRDGAGGNKATILIKIGKMYIDTSDATLDAKKLSEMTREVMQKELDELYALKDSNRALA